MSDILFLIWEPWRYSVYSSKIVRRQTPVRHLPNRITIGMSCRTDDIQSKIWKRKKKNLFIAAVTLSLSWSRKGNHIIEFYSPRNSEIKENYINIFILNLINSITDWRDSIFFKLRLCHFLFFFFFFLLFFDWGNLIFTKWGLLFRASQKYDAPNKDQNYH